MAKIEIGCAQTRGTFQLSGKITGRMSQQFIQEDIGKSGKSWRRVHFGVEIEPDHVVYLDLFGSERDKCYASKRTTSSDGKFKNETREVPWNKRFNIEKDPAYKGYTIIGVTCGCEKVVDSKGILKNNVKHLTEFDACDEVQNLHDGDSVFIRGNIEYSTFNGNHRINYVPTQISLCRDIDFDDMEFTPNARFTQSLVLMGVEPNKETGEYDVQAKIVNYDSIEDAEFHIKKEFAGLAKTLKKQKQYTHIKVFGRIAVEGETEEVEVSNEWGMSANPMERIASPFVRKLIIEGADPQTLDTSSHSEEVIEKAMDIITKAKNAKEDYGGTSDDDWGGNKSDLDGEDLDDFDSNTNL